MECFLYPILVPDRDVLKGKLKTKGVETNISWPMPIYEQKIYKKFRHDKCPIAKDFTLRVLCLPIFYEMSEEEQDYVIECIRESI